MPPNLFGEVIRPALADRMGFALFIGTPKGKNAFYDLYRRALEAPDWHAALFRASETGILKPSELLAARREMTPEQYAQEFECSFNAAIVGAYYARLLSDAEREGRLAGAVRMPGGKVHTAWDLGMHDQTAIWFFQADASGEVRLVDYYEASGEGLHHYAGILKDKGYPFGIHIAPHDIMVRELGSGKSRLETALSLGIRFSVAPNLPLMEGIHAVRQILPRCRFDEKTCRVGLEALRQYRAAYNDRMGTGLGRPVHDWTSHAADAFRYLAVGLHLARTSDMSEADANNLYERYAQPRME